MASYHTSFTFLNKNSVDEGLMIASFEPDSGFVDTFLGMDQVVSDSYNGVKKFFYGNKYNTTATISITVVKVDGTDFSVADNRRILKWLSGNKQASWIDLYEGNRFAYSFYGSVTAIQQQKLDARVVGIQFDFSSIYPWAYSAPKSFYCYVGHGMLDLDDNGVLIRDDNVNYLGCDDDGVVYNHYSDPLAAFEETDAGVVYSDPSVKLHINNQSDDLYTYTNLNLVYRNENGTGISIKNTTLGEETLITEISPNEVITLSAGQFIVSDIPNKIFGDTFNFVWPRMCPGKNEIIVSTIAGEGKGNFDFSYRYPIKIGDCAVDVDNLIGSPTICAH